MGNINVWGQRQKSMSAEIISLGNLYWVISVQERGRGRLMSAEVTSVGNVSVWG